MARTLKRELRLDIRGLVDQVEKAYGIQIPELESLRLSDFEQWKGVPQTKVMLALVVAFRIMKGQDAKFRPENWPRERDVLAQLIISLARDAAPADADPAEIEAGIAYLLYVMNSFLEDEKCDVRTIRRFSVYLAELLCTRVYNRLAPRREPVPGEVDEIAALGLKYGTKAAAADPVGWSAFVPSTPLQVQWCLGQVPEVTEAEWLSLVQRLIGQSKKDGRFIRTDDEVVAELDALRQEATDRAKLEQELAEPLRLVLARLNRTDDTEIRVKVVGVPNKPSSGKYAITVTLGGCENGCLDIAVRGIVEKRERAVHLFDVTYRELMSGQPDFSIPHRGPVLWQPATVHERVCQHGGVCLVLEQPAKPRGSGS